MNSIIYVLLILTATNSKIIDHTYHDFFLYKDTKDILIYDSYADLFHITNLSLYKDIIKLESTHINKSNHLQWQNSYDLNIIEMLLSQILPSREKGGINEIGTLWKWRYSRT